jgi:biotin transport system ATP-binding protein
VSDHLLEDAGHRLVLVTHDLELAARCDTAVLFASGTVSVTGEPGAVVSAYQELLAEGSLPC